MTEQEAKIIMKSLGWTYLPRRRYHKDYVYAEQRRGGKKKEKYIGTYASLETLTKEELTDKLS